MGRIYLNIRQWEGTCMIIYRHTFVLCHTIYNVNWWSDRKYLNLFVPKHVRPVWRVIFKNILHQLKILLAASEGSGTTETAV